MGGMLLLCWVVLLGSVGLLSFQFNMCHEFLMVGTASAGGGTGTNGTVKGSEFPMESLCFALIQVGTLVRESEVKVRT